MAFSLDIVVDKSSSRTWTSNPQQETMQIEVSMEASAFPNDSKQMCESKVDLVCGNSSIVCPG